MLPDLFRSRCLPCLLVAVIISGCVPARRGEQDPKRDGNFLRGQTLLSQLDYEGAVAAFDRALETNPRSAPAHFELGFLYKDHADDPAAAIYHFQHFIQLNPDTDQAQLIQRHMDDCKMELAKLFLIAPVVPDVQRELDQLKDVVKQLQSENESLRRQLTSAATPKPVTPKPIEQPATPPSAPVTYEAPTEVAVLPEPSPAPALQPVIHTIRNGDYPAKIARRYGVKLEALLKANPGLNPRRLKIGTKVSIPTG